MASYTGKAVVATASVTFGGVAYDCKSLPAGAPESCEMPNITICSDNVQKFGTPALKEKGEISVVMSAAPALNAVGSLSINLSVSVAGGEASASSIDCGDCIVTNVEPSTIEAGGDRVRVYTVNFRPTGD